jgi:hypothetical protein
MRPISFLAQVALWSTLLLPAVGRTQGVPGEPHCGDILPVEKSLLIQTDRAWNRSQKDAGSGGIKVDLIDVLKLDLGVMVEELT